jgi:hypothetical protein
VVVIEGKWADGSALLAIPNFARNNRDPKVTEGEQRDRGAPPTSVVWIRDK